MKITTYKTNKVVQDIPESRIANGFSLTIVDGTLTSVKCNGDCEDVLTLPDDVRIIDKEAFEYVRVKEVILPAGIDRIDDGAFRQSTIEKIDLTNVKVMGNGVFELSELKEVTYSKYLTYVPERCFRYTKLSKFDIPKQVTDLKPYCFANTNLEKIDLSGITSLEESVFSDCCSIKEIILPKTITKIPNDFCRRCCDLKKIDLSHVKKIGTGAFSECSKLDVGSLSAKIGSIAFAGTAVKHLEIKNVSKLEESVYRNCPHLESVTINGKGTIPFGLFSGCKNLKNITIGEGITAIGDSAFAGTAVENIVLPSTLTTIGSKAFEECEELKEIILNDGLTTISGFAFSQTKNLSEISIPDSVKYIGSECFAYSGIENAKLPENNDYTAVSGKIFVGCKKLKSVKLPDNINAISNYAFNGCTSLQHINLEKIDRIGSLAFADTALKKITLNATTIDPWAFAKCEQLEEADLSGIAAIKLSSHLFFNCRNLSKINLPKNQIKVFDDNCFYLTAINEIVFDAKKVIVKSQAFGFTKLKKVVVDKSCDNIQLSDYAFRKADIGELVIPDFMSAYFNNMIDRIM